MHMLRLSEHRASTVSKQNFHLSRFKPSVIYCVWLRIIRVDIVSLSSTNQQSTEAEITTIVLKYQEPPVTKRHVTSYSVHPLENGSEN
jgi:hypothetical protein